MATAKPMAQQQNKKYAAFVQDSSFTDGIVDHDMHLKMSKKIAQLTKVQVYESYFTIHIYKKTIS